MFRKLTAIEPVSLEDWAEEKLHTYAEEVVLYRDIPENDEEIIRRIGSSAASIRGRFEGFSASLSFSLNESMVQRF